MKGSLTREYKGRLQMYRQEGAKWVWRYAVHRNCAYCNVEFPHPERYTGPRQAGKYCSMECRDKANAVRYDRQRPRKKCVVCGKQFIAPNPSHAYKYATCSLPCRTEYRRRRKVAYWEVRA